MTAADDVPGFHDLTEIGRGGFGTVYRAPQEGFGRDVAIKILNLDATQLDSRARGRFETETTTTGKLSTHPHIVTLHQTGVTASGQPYLVMSYMSGGSLGQQLKNSGPLPWEDATAVAIKIAGALGTAHRAGIIHRDVKPDNILIDEFGAPVLGDFGIASVTTGDVSTMTATGKITGTVAFSPPELLDGRRPGERTDVFALAATTFALIVGHPPFVRPDDESFTQVVARMMREDAPDLRAYGVPAPIAAAVARGLARSPEARTHSVVRFGQDLQDARRQVGISDIAMVLPQGSSQGAAEERTLALPALSTRDARSATTVQRVPVASANTPTQPHPSTRVHPVSDTPAPAANSYSPGWGTVLVALVVLSAVAGGGLFLALNRQGEGSAMEQALVPPGTESSQTDQETDEPAQTQPSDVLPADELPSPTPLAPTATPQASPSDVATAPAPTAVPDPGLQVTISTDDPDAETLASVLGRWAQAINDGEYADAFSQYTPQLRDRVTFERFANGNSTSTISGAELLAVSPAGDVRHSTIRFRSEQDAEFGPDGQTCSVWQLQWAMIPAAGGWLVDNVDAAEGYPQVC